MKPLNPSFDREVEDSFRRQPIMKLIGARLSLVEPGVVEITLPYRTDLVQQNGYLHAGIVTTIARSPARIERRIGLCGERRQGKVGEARKE